MELNRILVFCAGYKGLQEPICNLARVVPCCTVRAKARSNLVEPEDLACQNQDKPNRTRAQAVPCSTDYVDGQKDIIESGTCGLSHRVNASMGSALNSNSELSSPLIGYTPPVIPCFIYMP